MVHPEVVAAVLLRRAVSIASRTRRKSLLWSVKSTVSGSFEDRMLFRRGATVPATRMVIRPWLAPVGLKSTPVTCSIGTVVVPLPLSPRARIPPLVMVMARPSKLICPVLPFAETARTCLATYS
ncbi:hypothetical protein ABIA35_000022 [Catenulispora sp. MAP12-49]